MSFILPKLLSDGMVLQRDTGARLWGTSDTPVTVTFLGREYHADPTPDGSWEVVLNGLAPGGPYTMQINEAVIRDVYVGDVWLCSGQSNMQLPMRRAKHMYPEEMQAPCPHIRQFMVPQRTSFSGPQKELAYGCWSGAASDTIEDFSAVGYFFAKRLYERYHVPIGLIVAAIGGTPVHSWMSAEDLKSFPDLLLEAEKCRDERFILRTQAEEAKQTQAFYDGIDRTDPGIGGAWHLGDYDDSVWAERNLTEPFLGTGSFWLRKTLQIPSQLAGKPATLFLGTITDWDTVYVNGNAVGNTTYRYPPREYAIPALPYGKCVIAIRVITRDGGGFTPGKQYLLATEEGSFDLSGFWRFQRGGQGTPYPGETFFHYKPTGLYNGMIAPLMKYIIKGAIWYQGESDAGNPLRYAEKFKALVLGWRKSWGLAFPFLYTELAHWSGGDDWDALRIQQRLSLQIPRTAMAAAFDLGEHNDLHPQNKQAVGDRLARCAMRVAYGETMAPSPFEAVGFGS